jgi:hypothetical protein
MTGLYDNKNQKLYFASYFKEYPISKWYKQKNKQTKKKRII